MTQLALHGIRMRTICTFTTQSRPARRRKINNPRRQKKTQTDEKMGEWPKQSCSIRTFTTETPHCGHVFNAIAPETPDPGKMELYIASLTTHRAHFLGGRGGFLASRVNRNM